MAIVQCELSEEDLQTLRDAGIDVERFAQDVLDKAAQRIRDGKPSPSV